MGEYYILKRNDKKLFLKIKKKFKILINVSIFARTHRKQRIFNFNNSLNTYSNPCIYVASINIYTYIIGHYKPSVRIINLVSHTTYVVCVTFIHKWREQHFKVDSERKIF